jgi:hypothetical protein
VAPPARQPPDAQTDRDENREPEDGAEQHHPGHPPHHVHGGILPSITAFQRVKSESGT